MSAGENGDNGALKHSCAEGRHTINRQIEKIHNEDDKAIKISRLNLLVLGLLVSGISFAIQSQQLQGGSFYNLHVVVGTIAVVISTVLASMTYTSSTFKMGLSGDPIEQLKSGDIDESEYFDKLGDLYPTWISANHDVHRTNANAITWALIFSIVGFIFLIGGVSVGIATAAESATSTNLFVAELLAGLVIGFCIYYSDSIFKGIMKIADGN